MTIPSDDRPAEGAGSEAAARPAWFTEVDDLRRIADRLKKLIEARRWAEVEALLALDQVWAFDRPLPLAEAVAALAAVLGDAVDIHLWVEKILKAQAADGAGHLTLNCCLMWGEAGNFKDHELELDLHLGFAQGAGGSWAFRYLGVTPGTPEQIPFPQEPAAAKDERPTADPATHAADAATDVPPPIALALPGALPFAAPPGQVLAYLPVLVPAGTLQPPSPRPTAPAAAAGFEVPAAPRLAEPSEPSESR